LQDKGQTGLSLDQLAFAAEPGFQGFILISALADQDFGGGADVSLVEKPDLKGIHLLGNINTQNVTDPYTTLAEEFPARRLNTERTIKIIISEVILHLKPA